MPLTAGPVARAQAALERAQALQPELGAFVELTPQLALALARRAEDELAAGRSRGPLHGLPVAVKDVIDVAGLPTRLGAARPGPTSAWPSATRSWSTPWSPPAP